MADTKSLARAERRLSKLGARVLRNRRARTFHLIDAHGGGPAKRCRFSLERGVEWIDDLYGWTAAEAAELSR